MKEAVKELKELKKHEQLYLKGIIKERDELNNKIYKSNKMIVNYNELIEYVK